MRHERSFRSSLSLSTVSATLLDVDLNHSVVEIRIVSILCNDDSNLHRSNFVRAANVQPRSLFLAARLEGEGEDNLLRLMGKRDVCIQGLFACALDLGRCSVVDLGADNLSEAGVAGEGVTLGFAVVGEIDGSFVAGN